MANTLCVGTLNVRSINNKLKRRVLYNYLRKYKIDVACLQETYINNNTIHDMQKEWRGNIFHIQGTNRSSGLVILTSSKIMHEEMEIVKKTDRILIIKLKISNVVYTFVNCYAPNTTTDKVNFLHQLQDEIQEIETDSLWAAGDFNFALEQTDNIAGLPHHEREVTTQRNARKIRHSQHLENKPSRQKRVHMV